MDGKATFVGSQACTECHQEQAKSFQTSGHSRALRIVRPEEQPPDAEFFHRLSGRSYRVYRNDGEFRHRESMRNGNGEELLLSDLAVKYVVGNGHQGLTYLVEREGYLTESPITWYRSQNAWSMSPGFNAPRHRSFERAVVDGCMHCHSGRFEIVDGSTHKLAFHELAIGCERCHGPGSLHQSIHSATDSPASDEPDWTIFHPVHATRDVAEAICAQCHLSGASLAEVRGRSLSDFRPGQRVAEHRIHYKLANTDSQMTVAGHVEQLRSSECYQKAEAMTCTTCHDPHGSVPRAQVRELSRKSCISCHQESGCGMPDAQRREKSPQHHNDCVHCHMPASGSEVPHVAMTQHRIGIHTETARENLTSSEPLEADELVPIEDLSHLSELDRKRGLGLAYLERARRVAKLRDAYFERAKTVLEEVQRSGLNDPEIPGALAQIAYEQGRWDAALNYAKEALSRELLPVTRDSVLWVHGDVHLRRREPELAIEPLEALVRYRPNSEHNLALARAFFQTRSFDRALAALEAARRSNPGRLDVQQGLVEALNALNLTERARQEERQLRLMKRLQPLMDGP